MKNIKSEIIPNYLKENIDEILEQQLFNANRYYAESNPNISGLMQKEVHNSPETFLNRLVNRWNWHNTYYELLLEPAYISLVKQCEIELAPEEIDDLIKVYITCCLVDEATLVMSGSIKKYLEYNYQNISILDDNLSYQTARKMLITPPIETFFAQYQIEHLYYIYLIKNNDKNKEKFKAYLINKYHAKDEEIFTSRFNKRFKNKLNMSKKELLEEIKKYKIPDSYKINHFYFTLEHSDRKAIRDILIYDNLTEKLIASNLIGISGFLLRKKILEYLNSSNLLLNNGYIYEFNKEIIIKKLRQLKEERKLKMDKDVKPYKQRGDTCGIACMMMVLEYYEIITKANWYDEKRLYKLYGSKYMIGTPFSAIAFHLSKKGLNTTIYHSSKDLFNNNQKMLSDEIFNLSIEEYKTFLDRAKSFGCKVINGITINSKLLKDELEKGNLIILAGEFSNIYHAILITGYKDDSFVVCDPLYKEKQLRTPNEIDSFLNTSIGSWFITVNNKTKEKDRLMSSLDKISKEAENFMSSSKVKELHHENK